MRTRGMPGLKAWNLVVVFAIGALWLATSTQREKRVVDDAHTERVGSLEDEAAKSPQDPAALLRLAQAYLDAHASGMAVGVIERAPASLRGAPEVEHLYARALLDQGRSADAQRAELRVLARCADPAPEMPPCSSFLVASATRRADILQQLVELGVEDANAHPEASSLAYHNATRQVSFTFR